VHKTIPFQSHSQSQFHSHSQTDLTHISEEEFQAAFTPEPISFLQRIFQVLFFITIGWIRLILLLIFNVLFLLLHQPFLPFTPENQIAQLITLSMGRFYVRFMLFFFGLFYVRVQGHPDPNTRQFCFNHTSPFDGVLFFSQHLLAFVMMSGIRSVPVYGKLMEVAGSVFIDRSSQSGNSQVLSNLIQDKSRPPLGLAPEGKLSNGDVVYKFRTGGFLTSEQIQPVTIRYYRLLPGVGSTSTWLCPTPGSNRTFLQHQDSLLG
jgi:1-acyl-sn-glycerol-3-phosphate acyltransferase